MREKGVHAVRKINMARPRNGAELTVAQLEKLLANRKTELDILTRDRAKIQKRVDAIDEKIARLGGGGGSTGGGGTGSRAKNTMSLVEAMAEVLTKDGGAMAVGDIVSAVEATGYKSTSDNFRGIVNQTLIKERKRFINTARGIYQIKK